MLDEKAGQAGAWRMLVLVAIVLNLAMGVNFSAYGTLMAAIQREFSTGRALAAGGISMLTLALGLLSPLVGGLMRRFPVRALMAIGIVLNAAGYVAISLVSSIWAMLAVYALMIGPGFCLFSVLPCTAIVSAWFDEGRGRALGLLGMPIGNMLMPMVAAAVLAHWGLRQTFLAQGAIILALLPILLLVRERPVLADAGIGEAGTKPASAATLTSGGILRTPAFLVLALGVAITSAGGLVIVTHIVALGTGRGLDLATASFLLVVFSMAGLVGAPAFGWIADRLGGGAAFAILCFAAILPWLSLIVAGDSLPVLLLCVALIGICSNGIVPLFGHTMIEWVGTANLGLAMGLAYLLQIPFLFGAGPLAGAMFDATGSYTPTILLHCTAFALTGLMFLRFRPRPVDHPLPHATAADLSPLIPTQGLHVS